MHLSKLFVGDVGVNLRSGDRGVTEEGLDRTDVGAVDQKIGGIGVTQSVGCHFFNDTGLGGIFLDNALNRARSQIFSVGVSAV